MTVASSAPSIQVDLACTKRRSVRLQCRHSKKDAARSHPGASIRVKMHAVKRRISSKVTIKAAESSIAVQHKSERIRRIAGPKKRQSADSAKEVNASIRALIQPANVNSPALLPQAWYRRDSLEVAPALLGKILRKDGIELRITEVGTTATLQALSLTRCSRFSCRWVLLAAHERTHIWTMFQVPVPFACRKRTKTLLDIV